MSSCHSVRAGRSFDVFALPELTLAAGRNWIKSFEGGRVLYNVLILKEITINKAILVPFLFFSIESSRYFALQFIARKHISRRDCHWVP